jgi:hypothetical protein
MKHKPTDTTHTPKPKAQHEAIRIGHALDQRMPEIEREHQRQRQLEK